MEPIVINPTATSQWQALVNEAEEARAVTLGEDLQSYLVFLLMRFASQPEVASSVIAMDFLESHQAVGQMRQELLRDVGDKCLLFSGLFPETAKSRLVKVSYFVSIGQSAYGTLSSIRQESHSELFASLSDDFISLMDVMHAMRDISNAKSMLPLDAMDLWHESHSEQALKILRRYVDAVPVVCDPNKH